MLKELASLLCSLFVPKRAVNYVGGYNLLRTLFCKEVQYA